ncbi:MAG: hypothetical protein R3B46_04990 [Phycisphaerales bacterium]
MTTRVRVVPSPTQMGAEAVVVEGKVTSPASLTSGPKNSTSLTGEVDLRGRW